jgi:transposase
MRDPSRGGADILVAIRTRMPPMDDSTFTNFKMPSRERVDIRVGVERRRRWGREDKLRIVRDSLEPKAVISDVARRHEVSASLIYTWRKQALAGLLEGFHAVRLVAEPSAALPAIEADTPVPDTTPCSIPQSERERQDAAQARGIIEIALPSGVEVRVPADVEPRALRCVLVALGARTEIGGTSPPSPTGPDHRRRR